MTFEVKNMNDPYNTLSAVRNSPAFKRSGTLELKVQPPNHVPTYDDKEAAYRWYERLCGMNSFFTGTGAVIAWIDQVHWRILSLLASKGPPDRPVYESVTVAQVDHARVWSARHECFYNVKGFVDCFDHATFQTLGGLRLDDYYRLFDFQPLNVNFLYVSRLKIDDYGTLECNIPQAILEMEACARCLKKDIIRGVLTDGKRWMFLILRPNKEGMSGISGGVYTHSEDFSLLEPGTDNVSTAAADLLADFIIHWLHHCHDEVRTDDFYTWRDIGFAASSNITEISTWGLKRSGTLELKAQPPDHVPTYDDKHDMEADDRYLYGMNQFVSGTSREAVRTWIDAVYQHVLSLLTSQSPPISPESENVTVAHIDSARVWSERRECFFDVDGFIDCFDHSTFETIDGRRLIADIQLSDFQQTHHRVNFFYVSPLKIDHYGTLEFNIPQAILEMEACARCFKKDIIRGVLTNGQKWMFLILRLNQPGVSGIFSGVYTHSDEFNLLEPGTDNVSRAAVDLLADIIIYWIRHCHDEIGTNDLYAWRDASLAGS